MKKFWAVIILILTSLTCMACGGDASIRYTKDMVYLNMGYTYIVSPSDIKISHSSSEYEIVSLDESIATVSANIIYPVSEGETSIRIRLAENTAIYTDFTLVVTNITYVEDASIRDEKVYINIGKESEKYNPITYENIDANEVPEVTYDSRIIDYDYLTGKITPKTLGETIVIVLFRDCNVSFRVSVIDEIYAISMEIPNCNVVEGYSGKFSFLIFPDNANTYAFDEMDNEYLKVYSDGSYEAKKAGKVTVKCNYYSELNGEKKEVEFQVNILAGISGLDMTIVDPSQELESSYYLVEKMYRIRINNRGISIDNLDVSGINKVGNLASDSKGIYVDFYFKNTGENNITINVKFDGYTTSISSTKNYNVSSINDILIRARSGMYYVDPNSNDGKYYLNISGGKIKFVGCIDDAIISDIEVYNETNGNEKLTGDFVPTSTGEFTFRFEYAGVTLGYATVVVQ